MKKVAILCAMSEELEPLNPLLRNEEILRKTPWVVRAYQPMEKCHVVSVITKIGKAAAAAAVASIIETEKPDFLINIGSAGGLHGIPIKSVIISIEAAYADVDVTAFGYRMGQMAGQSPTFKSLRSIDIMNALKQKHPTLHEGMVCSVDSFVADKQRVSSITEQYPTAMAIDMEFASIAQTATAYDIPFIGLKSISDTADGAIAINDFKNNITTLTETVMGTLQSLLSIIGGQNE